MSTERSRRRHRGQAGQALTEAAVGLAVLATLAALVVYVGKVQSIGAAATSASRLLAFGCAVAPGGCAAGPAPEGLVDSVRELALGPWIEEGQVPEGERALWHDRRAARMLDRQAGLHAVIGTPRFDAGVGLAGSERLAGIPNPAEIISSLAGPGRFGLDIADGLREARIELDVQPALRSDRLDDTLLAMALRMNASTAVLADAWSASGPAGGDESVEARVDRGRRLAPAVEAAIAAGYAPARLLLEIAGQIGIESGVKAFRPGRIDVDVVPDDRLAP